MASLHLGKGDGAPLVLLNKPSIDTPPMLSSHHPAMDAQRIYRFTITARVHSDHVAYDDPEWVADAAAGALKNEYGIECVYENIEEIHEEDA